MNTKLWNSILNFNLDDAPGDYRFTTRLASENYWTEGFTEKAVLEYKKFMYLAAISDQMVSPCEVVDTVWHQHLVFTQSYNDLCSILGKQIQHVPSTHNKADFSKFMHAKERTKNLYREHFGEQPEEIWEFSGMYESLEWPKAKIHIRTFLLLGILAFFLLIFPLYFLLRPIYVHIPNPAFSLGYIVLIAGTFLFLRIHNSARLKHLFDAVRKSSFVKHLSPSEAIYLQRESVNHVVHNVIHQLVRREKIRVNDDQTLEFNLPAGESVEGFSTGEKYTYPQLHSLIVSKPMIKNVASSMDAFKKYFTKSIVFGRLFYFNFGILALVLMLGVQRVVIGMLRDKPVDYIVIVLIVFFLLLVSHLRHMMHAITKNVVPEYYSLMTKRGNHKLDPTWQYFVFGTAILSPEFKPMVTRMEQRPASTSDNGSSSCGSSCGSSCSSCGGCGGGD